MIGKNKIKFFSFIYIEIPVEITDELQIEKNQLINCLMIVSPTTKWIVKVGFDFILFNLNNLLLFF
jgi:hypothetical protein